jgi:DNA repair protein RadA/Sms
MEYTFVCQKCGARYPKWVGKCNECLEWNTLIEEPAGAGDRSGPAHFASSPPSPIDRIAPVKNGFFPTGLREVDHALGGGIVPGSVALIGGEPGIGKSTLMLQIAGAAAIKKRRVLYVSGEESPQQIKLRASRLNAVHPGITIFSEISLQKILEAVKSGKIDLLIIDSIQTLFKEDIAGPPGSISQIRECTAHLMAAAKSSGPSVLIVGHVTKEGNIAGPKLLEHIVDTVLYFEGDNTHLFRVLRVMKNRFGPANEIGVFEMTGKGLRDVSNPSHFFLADSGETRIGASISCAMQGTRPILLEVQALVTGMSYSMPQRTATGIDAKRLSLILAVLEKKAGLPLGSRDIHINIAGGISIQEPALDLSIACSIVSSHFERPVPEKTLWLGEIGLGGEVRNVSQVEARLSEAGKMGHENAFIPKSNLKGLKPPARMNLSGLSSIGQLMENI